MFDTEGVKLGDGLIALDREVTEAHRATEAQARSEAALREAEAVLREAEAAGHVGHWTWVPPSDGQASVPRWSPEAYRILGLDPAGPALDLDAMTALLPPDSLARSVAAIERVLADGEPYVVEIEFVRPDGFRGWTEIRGGPREGTRRGTEVSVASEVGEGSTFWLVLPGA
jgi:two-component system, cell cycle sensor histidine kinase PleC